MAVQKGKETQKTTAGGKGILQWLVIAVCIALTVCGAVVLKAELAAKEEKTRMAQSKVVLYEGPKSLRDATEADLENSSEKGRDIALLHCTDTQVTINGADCFVYDTNVNHTRQWVSNYYPPMSRTPVTYFDFEGTVEVQVTVPDVELESVKISPLSYEIEPVVDIQAHTVTFQIDTPDAYTLQFNGAPERAVHIFANALEKEEDIPDKNDPSVIYIGPGEWNIESIMLRKGQTLYLAGGSVVHGIANANFESDITVCGRGILDCSQIEGWQGRSASIPLKFDHCKNVTIKDIMVLNPNAWACQAYDSTDGVIDNVKIISSRPNGDGISLQSCQNYEVKNCFVRTWDDSLVVKNYDQNSENLTFRHMQLWTDLAQSMEVGYETNKGNKPDSSITNVTFEDITVLNNFHKPVISVHNGDDALLDNITFRDIVVEHEEIGGGDADEMPYLIDINIMQSGNWSTTKDRGTIRNVTIENVSFLEGWENASRIQGFDAEHNVENVVIKNLNLFGKAVKGAEDGQFEVDEATVSGISFQ